MNSNVSDALFVRRRSTGSVTIPPEITTVQEAHQSEEIRPIMTTMADIVSPLLTSMKLFGLYFKRETCDKLADGEPSRRRNLSMIHSAVVAALAWINVVRMFSVFTARDVFGAHLFFKFNRITPGIFFCRCMVALLMFKTLTLKFSMTIRFRYRVLEVHNRATTGCFLKTAAYCRRRVA